MNVCEVEMMREAYEKLYMIENGLRDYIKEKMKGTYRPNYFFLAPQLVLRRKAKKDFSSLYLHELEGHYFRIYPNVFSSLSQVFMNLYINYIHY